MTASTRRGRLSLILSAILLIIAAAALAVTGWTDTFKLGSPVQVSGRSPFNNCTADNPAGQLGTLVANSEVEPWLVINPRNPSNLVAAWSQDWWMAPGQAARGQVAGVSFDGGKSWQKVVIPGLTLCSGGTAVRSADSWLAFAPNGDLYHAALGNGVPSNPDGRVRMLLISKSTDGGLSWGRVTTLEEDTDLTDFSDKASVTADPTDPNVVYAVWTRFHFGPGGPSNGLAVFSRTLNGGQTWDPPRVIFDPGSNNFALIHQIVVLPDGTLVDIFTDIIQTTDQSGTMHFRYVLSVLRSQDRGGTWLPGGTAIQIAEMAICPSQTFLVNCLVDPETGQPIRNAAGLSEVAVDRNNGHLYVEWSDRRFSNFQYNSVAFSMSTDGGFTWSRPIKINKTPTNIPPSNQQAYGHSMDVASDGTIGVAYYDFRFNDPNPGLLTDYWLVHCHSAVTDCTDAANWKDENRLTSASFDLERSVFSNGLFGGEYQGMTADGTDLLSVWGQPHDKDPGSIFFSRVRVSR